MAVTEETRARVVVLGSEGHGRDVRAHTWDRIPEGLNVADYDAVILNFVPLTESDELRNNIPLDRVPRLDQFIRLLFSADSMVIAVGDPGLRFGETPTTPGRLSIGGLVTQEATWWLPCHVPAKHETGEMIRDINEEWAFWFKTVRHYAFHFGRGPIPSSDAWTQQVVADAAPAGTQGIIPLAEALATTRAGEPVALRGVLQAARLEQARNEQRVQGLATSSPFVWLPPPTEVSHREGVDLLLREVLGVHAEARPPDWITSYRLPREQESLRDRDAKLDAVRDARVAAETAAAVAQHEARFGRLLYEQGKHALESIVREALATLGATVAEPSRGGIEDGRLTDPSGRRAMLEIKGKAGQLGLEDVRQLSGWMQDALAEEAWKGKGILVANVRLGEPPDRRADLVGSNALTFARNIGVCIVTASQLFEALHQEQSGTLNRDAFWNAIFDTDGLCSLPEPRPNT